MNTNGREIEEWLGEEEEVASSVATQSTDLLEKGPCLGRSGFLDVRHLLNE
jgi:hypothetical protein